jgi:hypothetical protein
MDSFVGFNDFFRVLQESSLDFEGWIDFYL